MANGKYPVLIVFSPESSSLSTVSNSMAPIFDPSRFAVTVLPAARATISDLLGAEILVFGSNDEANFSHGGFASLREALAAADLGRRTAGLFSSISSISVQNLNIMLKDTGVQLIDAPLLIKSSWDDPKTGEVLKDWVKRLLAAHEQTLRIH